MGFGSYLSNGFRALIFDKAAVASVIADPDNKKNSLILLGILSVLCGIGVAVILGALSFLTNTTYPLESEQLPVGAAFGLGFVLGVIGCAVISVLSTGIYHLLAKLFGGKASFVSFFAISLTSTFAAAIISIPVSILEMIPILGLLISLAFFVYLMFVLGFYIREAHALSTGKTVLVVLIPILVFVIIPMILVLLYFASLSPDIFLA